MGFLTQNISADMGFRCFRWAGGQVGRCCLGQFWGKIKKVFSGINLLYKNVSNSTNCNLDPAIFDPLPRKIFQNKRQPLNFAAHGKLDLRPKIIHFFLKLALEVKKVVGCGSKIWSWATLFRAKFFWKKPVFWAIGVPGVSKITNENRNIIICDFLTPQGPLLLKKQKILR